MASGRTRWLPRSTIDSRKGLAPPPTDCMPEVGNQWRPAAKMMISGMPITKYGIE